MRLRQWGRGLGFRQDKALWVRRRRFGGQGHHHICVAPGFVAGFFTRTTVRSPGVIDLQYPAFGPVRNAVPDLVFLFGCVDFVASPAGSAAFGFIDMHKVQVSRAIAELCQGRRLRFGDDRLLVTLEAEGVNFRIETRVKLRGIFVIEQAEILAAVRIVAGAAIFVGDRAVQFRVLSQQRLHVGQLLALVILDTVLAMAGDAKVVGQALEEMLNIGAVRVMAIAALGAGGESRMRHLALTGELFDVLMTTEAERVRFLDQQLFDFGIVRVVAAHAALFGRDMAEF